MASSDASGEHILFVVNVGWFFISHRLPIALAAIKAGYRVSVASALDRELDADTVATLRAHGIAHHQLRFSRSGGAAWELLRDMRDMGRLYRELKPDIIHLVTLKPVVLGGIAARLAGIGAVVMAVPGRGSVFTTSGLFASIRRHLVIWLYRLAYVPGRSRVIIQNAEDRDYFLENEVFQAEDVVLIRGSGVEVQQYHPSPPSGEVVRVLLASRMLREKGVSDFVAVARRLRAQGVQAKFLLAGNPDPGNPASHTRQELQAWAAEGVVEWLGHVGDMRSLLSSIHIMCLPTTYGEGVPKVLIEAAAAARPIVTTDTAGCRDIVRHRSNGLLVQPRDVPALERALRLLIDDADLRREMGVAGRQLAERSFDVSLVVERTLVLYGQLR